MSKRLYVGNLPFSTTSEKLQQLFEAYGPLTEVMIVSFKDTGKSKGFGFVTIENDEQAAKAITEMNDKEIDGRKITVNEARPFDASKPRPNRFSDRPRYGSRGFGGERRGFGGGFDRDRPRYGSRERSRDNY